MKHTLAIVVAVVLLLTGVSRAQQAAPEPSLLRRLLDAPEGEGAELRRKLIAAGPESVRRQIADLEFAPTDFKGVTRLSTRCPDGHTRPYWVYLPKTYDPAKSYPLVVHLHGGVARAPLEVPGPDPAPGQAALEAWRTRLPEEWREELILLGVSAGAGTTGREAVWWRDAGRRNVLHMISELKRLVNIDDNRVFMEGHSDGGSGAFAFAAREPDAFAGYFPMLGSPLVPMFDGSHLWLENLRGARIYAVSGGADRLYPAAGVTPLLDQMKAQGAHVDFTVHPELGHAIAPVLADEIAGILKDKVAQWRRNPVPAVIDWTTDRPETGRRAWLSIDELLDFGDKASLEANTAVRLPGRRVRLGVQLAPEHEAPTVHSVVKGSTAEAMGLAKGDVIAKLDDAAIADQRALLEALSRKNPGDKVSVTVLRDGKEHKLEGQFEKPAPRQVLEARVLAEFSPGHVHLRARHAARVTLHVMPQLLDSEGRLRVTLQAADGKIITLREAAPVAQDAAVILDTFLAGADRAAIVVARLEFDLATVLGARPQKDAPQEHEDF